LEDGSVTEPINVNKASWERLIDLPSVGAADAKRIVEARQANGGFRSAEEVGALLGMKPHQVERLRRRAVFDGLAGTATASSASSSVTPSTASRTGFSTSPAAETRQGSLTTPATDSSKGSPTTSSTASPSSASPSASAPSSAPSAASRRIIDF
jgi:Helix-hairpin-helix motif